MLNVIGALGVGFVLGRRGWLGKAAAWAGPAGTAGVALLLFLMGAKIGSDAELRQGLATLGLEAAVYAVAAVAGSLAAVKVLERALLVFPAARGERAPTRAGGRVVPADPLPPVPEGEKRDKGMICLVTATLALGLAGGYLGLMPAGYARQADALIAGALALLVFAVGVDLGQKQDTLQEFATLGLRALLVPAGVAVGSMVGTMLAGLLLGLKWNEGAAIGAGFGWYSLSGVLISQLHSVRLGTLAFLSNVLRESLSIVILPWVYRYLGTLAAVAPGGATTMDVTLPVIVKVAGEEAGLVAFASGFILTLLAPILVPLLV
ncbi:lysine exporter LysO family protein [Gelria sp. Kuro-4]|uniref:lysine exporter LysO family protein n=1 Tax=Gelria sp. Kuro-4 TaxID=2796927 RepID=UPI001BF0710F|nr:lysine exporter LysO family protein [Gelria sp. Kuro-4]MDK2927291.1 hypothetical protein [Bacillota bacterium]BCV24060.1 hypothetical protein kuro4_08330 [Gelria sp. Kuro-4]